MPLRNNKLFTAGALLSILLLGSLLISMRLGAVDISTTEIFSALKKTFTAPDSLTLNERIFMQIRLPRALLCLLVGATLGVGGTLMQGLFRNPIVEPGLIGTSSGAAFGAAFYFVLGVKFNLADTPWGLPFAAFLGGALSTAIVLNLSQSRHGGKSSVVALLLTGVAINALFLSGVGFFSYIARDPQARSITFWQLGTLSGANWHSVTIIGITTIGGTLLSLRFANALNALIMGEDEAQLLGINIKRLKLIVLLVNVTMVAIATAFVGVIGFIGLIVPHLLRIINGSDNRFLIANSALLGGVLLSLADLVARLALAPAELPIGIVTSVVGVPVFVYLLRKKDYFF